MDGEDSVPAEEAEAEARSRTPRMKKTARPKARTSPLMMSS